jgi:multimeric flavodoxin WrbA
MKVLVINGSPNGERSLTMRLTRAFLEGLGEQAEVVETGAADIRPCTGCYACWFRTNGRCVQQDRGAEVLEKLRGADLVIWSIPVFCYSAPAGCKALMDRTLSFNRPEMYVGGDGRAHHKGYEDGSKKTVLISSGGLPDREGNFDGLIFQLRHMYGMETPVICCPESSLFMVPDAAPLTEGYLRAVRQAGAEYRETGCIAPETQQVLDTLMVPRETYIENCNAQFAQLAACGN